jgi:demethylmenaquinone methyltransferase/2-methoxy-6-polyprenyl-1,4-benzoquinol methylase
MATKNQAKPSEGIAREKQVRQIFSEIAPRYDLLNHLLSFNIDRRWRRRAVDRLGWEHNPGNRYLDACAGTFDLSLELATRGGFTGRVMATDFAHAMLLQGRGKIVSETIDPVCADSLRLPFADETFHGAMVAFGVRNLSDIKGGLGEFARILRPGARLVVLEFTEPPNPVMRRLYLLYFRRFLPLVGRLISGHPWAYTYLPESVRDFPGPADLASVMGEAGFAETDWELLTGGVAALHVGIR